MTKTLEEKAHEHYVQKTTDMITGLVGMGFSYNIDKGNVYFQTKQESQTNKKLYN